MQLPRILRAAACVLAFAIAALVPLSAAIAQPGPTHNGGGIPAYDSSLDAIRMAGQASQDPAPVSLSSSGTTQIIAGVAGSTIYVTGGLIYAGGTANFTFKAGTGSNCGTGTRNLSGAIPLKDQGGFSVGNGLGVVLPLRAGESLCANLDANAAVGGWLTYDLR